MNIKFTKPIDLFDYGFRDKVTSLTSVYNIPESYARHFIAQGWAEEVLNEQQE